MAQTHFIAQAIKHEGALTRDVGGPPHEHLEKVRWLAEHGSEEQQRRARLYLEVLRPATLKREREAEHHAA